MTILSEVIPKVLDFVWSEQSVESLIRWNICAVWVGYEHNIQSALLISNTGISKYSLLSKNTVYTTFLFLYTFQLLLSKTTDISKEIFWFQKIYFEISVV